MQDKNSNPIDDRFLEHSWQEMRSLLDRDMPVAAVGIWWKRYGWLLILLLGLTIGAGAGAFAFMKWSERTPEKPVITAPAVAITPSTPSTDEVIATVEPTPNPAALAEKADTKAEQDDISPLEISALTPRKIEFPLASPALAPLPLIEVTLADLTVELAPVVLEPAKNKRLQWGVQSGLHYQATSSQSGVFAGLALEQALGNEKWSLQTGLNYRFFSNLPGKAGQDELASASDPGTIGNHQDDTTIVSSTESLSGNSNGGTSVQNHYLELPLSLAYQIHPRWRLHTGLAGNLLLRSTPQRNGLFTPNANSPGSFQADFDTNNERSSAVQDTRIFALSLHTGLSFVAAEHWRIQIQYRQGFIPYEIAGKKYRNQSLDLGFSYWWGN